MLAEWDNHLFCPSGSAGFEAPQDDVTRKVFPCLPWFICRGSYLGLEAIILFIHDSPEKKQWLLSQRSKSLCPSAWPWLLQPAFVRTISHLSLPASSSSSSSTSDFSPHGPCGSTHAPILLYPPSPPPEICIVRMICALLHANFLYSRLVSLCLKLNFRTFFECSFIQHPNLPLSLKILLSQITAKTHPPLRHLTSPDQQSTTTWVMASIPLHLLKDSPFPLSHHTRAL